MRRSFCQTNIVRRVSYFLTARIHAFTCGYSSNVEICAKIGLSGGNGDLPLRTVSNLLTYTRSTRLYQPVHARARTGVDVAGSPGATMIV